MEVLVAVTVLAAGILGVLEAFSLSLRAGVRSTRLQDAARIAEKQLQFAVVQPAEKLQADRGTEGPFTWRLGVSESQENLMRASVTVEWLERGEPQTFDLTRVFLPRRVNSDDDG